MRLSDFDFDLPAELIAQQPAERRDASRLLVLDRHTGALRDESFSALTRYLRPGDLMVINDTRVLPARLYGVKPTGGRVEVLLVRKASDRDDTEWLAMTRSSKPVREGTRLAFGDGLAAVVIDAEHGELRRLRFDWQGDFQAQLERHGRIPLPPYIRRSEEDDDRDRYQTVFAREAGSVAAPTAGLHFTPGVLEELAGRGVEIRPLTLHVGPGTFQPVRVENLAEHRMHREYYEIPETLAAAVNDARRDGRRIVAVGTTTTRALESACGDDGLLCPGAGDTEIFITPGFRFRVVDALVTNFHLPRSTLLMLVSAFAGRERVLEAYGHAVKQRYRFFSYGDCMLIA